VTCDVRPWVCSPGWVLWISSVEDGQMGAKSKPIKIPGPKLNLKNSHAEFRSLKSFQKGLNDVP